jgi:SSS family solute:Na+ symporter
MILAFSLIYAALILGIGFFRPGKKTPDNYFVLGRTLTLPAFVASLVSTWYGGILGIGEYAYRFGVSNWLVFGVPYYLAAFVFAVFIAKRARRTEYYTIPDMLFRRFGRGVALVGAVVIFFMTVPGAYVLMLGVLIHTVFGYSMEMGIIVGTLFSIVYVYRGGLRSVVRTDLFQFALMFISFFFVLIYLWHHFGGLSIMAARLPRTHLTWTGGNSPQYIFVWYVIALATLVEPAFYQRCFAARDEGTAKRGILISIFFWFAFDAMTTTTGLYARSLLPSLEDPTNAFPVLAVNILPTFLGAVFFLGLLATVMSTVDSYSFLSAITLGRDIVWRIKGGVEDSSRRFSAWALILTGIVAVFFAITFKSVVDIWHHFGSVGTPALLFPLASTFSKREIIRPKEALAMMILGGGLSLFWILSPVIFPGLHGGYLLKTEPIFPGFVLSGLLFLVFWMRSRRRACQPA